MHIIVEYDSMLKSRFYGAFLLFLVKFYGIINVKKIKERSECR
jgi:hypothetical protein